MAVAGILVALLVAAWLQATRAGTRGAQEAAEDRAEAELGRMLHAVLEGAQWSVNSHLPQGVMRWEAGPGAFSLWSRAADGLPGPARWRVWVTGNGLDASVEDAQGQGARQRHWQGVMDLRLEVVQQKVEGPGDSMVWITPNQWDPAIPFRPVALRITWLTIKGQMRTVTSWR